MQSIVSSKRIAKNVGIFGGAQAFSVFAALVRNKVAAETIGSAAVGFGAIYNTAVTFISNFSGLGLSFSGIKHLSEIYAKDDHLLLEKEVANLRRLGLLCAFVGFCLTILFSPLISRIYFGDIRHSLQFSALSLFVVTTILSGIELAILRACQRIRHLAIALIWSAFVSIAVSVPLYILKGIEGVFYAVLISGVLESVLSFYFGNKTVRYSATEIWNFSKSQLFSPETRNMVSLGVAFLIGGVIASGAEMTIQSYITSVASVAVLGLYRAGYQLSISYTGMIFTAVNNDYYPRLSALSDSVSNRNILINRQIKVLLCITIPLVMVFVLLVPYLLPLLFNDTFNPVCHMVQIAALSIIIKSVTMPLNFLPLALGKPKDYLILEGSFWVLMVFCVIFGFRIYGLTGTGIGILLCHFIELLYVYIYDKVKYGYKIK